MSDPAVAAVRLSAGRTPTWDVTVTREDGEARTYRVMNESEETAKLEGLAAFDWDARQLAAVDDEFTPALYKTRHDPTLDVHYLGVMACFFPEPSPIKALEP